MCTRRQAAAPRPLLIAGPTELKNGSKEGIAVSFPAIRSGRPVSQCKKEKVMFTLEEF